MNRQKNITPLTEISMASDKNTGRYLCTAYSVAGILSKLANMILGNITAFI